MGKVFILVMVIGIEFYQTKLPADNIYKLLVKYNIDDLKIPESNWK